MKKIFVILILFSVLFTSKSFATDYSLSFDGSTNYVDFPFDSSMNPTGDFSVNVWVKTGASGAWQSAVTSRSASTTCGEDANQTSGYMIYIQPDEEWSFWGGRCTNNTWAQINTNKEISNLLENGDYRILCLKRARFLRAFELIKN